MKKSLAILLFVSALTLSLSAADAPFRRIKVPGPKGNAVNAVLTFSDQSQAIQIAPVKGSAISIPYADIDKFVYEYTKKHHVSEKSIATAPLGVGAVSMLRKPRNHWLEINYHDQDLPKTYVLRMDKHDYLHILEAVKAHTGKDAEILGNADKRR